MTLYIDPTSQTTTNCELVKSELYHRCLSEHSEQIPISLFPFKCLALTILLLCKSLNCFDTPGLDKFNFIEQVKLGLQNQSAHSIEKQQETLFFIFYFECILMENFAMTPL